jgi:DNA-binding CsgD family transcriptional regulator
MDGARTQRLLDFAFEVASADDLYEFRLALVAGIRRLVPADLASCTEVDLDTGHVVAPLDPVIDEREVVAALGRCASQHPLITRATGRAESISDYLTARRFHRLELYHDVYRVLGAEDQLAINITVRPRAVVGVALNRSRRGFAECDRQALDLLRPLLLRSYQRVLARQPAGVEERPECRALTPRERQIAALLSRGRTNQQIAGALTVSRRTVENHLQSIYRKLGVSNRTAAAAVLRPH